MFKVSQDIQLSSNNSSNMNDLNLENYTSTSKNVPIFYSNATKIEWKGFGLQRISLNEKNEFIIDASNAGNNILFVGICGPNGQCNEVSIKHIGQNIYNVCYQVNYPGVYIIVAKWGDDHIPGSPFHLIAEA